MLEEIKELLGESASTFTDAQINLCYRIAKAEVEEYCNRELDDTLELMAEQIAVIKLRRLDSTGLASQSYSGVSESFIDGYPAEIAAVLNRKRKIKVL